MPYTWAGRCTSALLARYGCKFKKCFFYCIITLSLFNSECCCYGAHSLRRCCSERDEKTTRVAAEKQPARPPPRLSGLPVRPGNVLSRPGGSPAALRDVGLARTSTDFRLTYADDETSTRDRRVHFEEPSPNRGDQTYVNRGGAPFRDGQHQSREGQTFRDEPTYQQVSRSYSYGGRSGDPEVGEDDHSWRDVHQRPLRL
jgi:hypothetical protein